MKHLIEMLTLGNQDAKAEYVQQHYGKFCKVDDYGNLYLNRNFKKAKPYMVAHLDTVDEQITAKQLLYDKTLGMLSAERNGKPCNLGADDGVGIVAALTLFDSLDVGVALFKDEEVGCIGSTNAEPNYLKNARFCIQLDRKGNRDCVFESMGVEIASDDFIKAVEAIAKAFNYSAVSGGMTDVVTLSSEQHVKVSCLNLSCGYYKPHTTQEYIKLDDMKKAIAFARTIIETHGSTTYPHEAVSLWQDDVGYLDYYGDDSVRGWLVDLIESQLSDGEIIEQLQYGITDCQAKVTACTWR